MPLPAPSAPALSSAWTFGSTGVLVDADEWRRLRVRHALSFLPAALLLVLLAVAARRAPCRLPALPPPPPDHGGDSVLTALLPPNVDAQCDAALHPPLTAAIALLGAVFWLASWSMRTASWRLATWAGLAARALLRRCARGPPESGYEDDEQPLLPFESDLPEPPVRGIEALGVLLHTASIELLRLAALATANALLLAELAVRVGLGRGEERPSDPIQPGRGWMGVGPQDPRFSMALWTALGWAAAQMVVGSCQILGQLELYRPPGAEVLFRPSLTRNGTVNSQARRGWERDAPPPPELTSAEQLAQARDALQAQTDLNFVETGECDVSDEEEDEEEFEEQLRLHEQHALEATLGAPLPDVPVSLSLLWRIDGVLFSLGTTLIMAAALAGAQGRLLLTPWDPTSGIASNSSTEPEPSPLPTPVPPHIHPLLPPLGTYAPTLTALILLHWGVSATWHFGVPLAGFARVTYASLLLALGLVAAGLGLWGVLQ